MAKKKRKVVRRPKAETKTGEQPRRRAGGRRKASWDLLSFADVEAWRTSHGLPRTRAAQALGVTNSTYHNWQTAKSAPTRQTQERLLRLMKSGPKAGATGGRPSPARPAGSDGGSPADGQALDATWRIVTCYLEHSGKGLRRDDLVALVSDVQRALRGL